MLTHRRLVPFLSILILVMSGLVTLLVATAKADSPNPDCALIVPANPLSATGLATPYELQPLDAAAGPCTEINASQAAFVEAAVLDPATGALGIYHPLVIDAGTTPAAAPVPVTLPTGAVVAIWFGSNGDTLTLTGPGASSCVNGAQNSVFGQFAYCNAPALFQHASEAIHAGKLTVPPLGTANDGHPCPTTRDFMVVDQDQSDNVATTYRVIDGKLAQNTAATRALVGSVQANGSDERLLAAKIDPALGCKPFTAPDLTDPGSTTSALVLNELSAARYQAGPALVPFTDPMAEVNGHTSVAKTNLYRAGVGQASWPAGETPETYCRLLRGGRARVAANESTFLDASSPASGVNLFDFLTVRYQASLDLLGCQAGPPPLA